ncbi:MAG: DUF4250 domain-containing protein [Clostridia bacterium]|nr:DUF4250 domain-containing protein [Clostridia bacterium]
MIKDVNILLSVVNTKLRDEYFSLENFLKEYEDALKVVEFLKENGFEYNEATNSFK